MILKDAFKGYLPKGPIWNYKVISPMGLEDDFKVIVSIKVKEKGPWVDYILDLDTKQVIVKSREPRPLKKVKVK